MNKQDIRPDLITIDGGTQQRPLDEDTLSRYTSLMADGVEFPPVEVVSDGVNFWLWDGFHRLECARRREQKSISAYVTEGRLREAIWLSFSANRAHGLPRQKGVAKKIIEAILTDTTWAKKSLAAIAKHVGVTRQYVSLVKDELARAHGASTCTIDEEKQPSEAKNEGEAATTEPDLKRDEEITVTRKGTTYTQRSQEKQQKKREKQDKPDEPPKDKVGQEIPEHLRELWDGRILVEGLVNDLTQLKNTLMKQVEARDPRISLLVQHESHMKNFQASYENLRRVLKMGIPYAVCRHCGGDAKDCKHCRGVGLINQYSYETTTPRGLKK
ncbi:MAG: hypothetical protein ABH852_01940 [Methanobacteriota archaeon]